MNYAPLRAPARLLTLASMLLVVAGCVVTPITPMTLAALDCAGMIQANDRQRIKPVPLPPSDAKTGEIWDGLDGQTAKLDKANGRGDDVVAKFDACQKRQAEVLAKLTAKRPWWKRLGRQ
jgi:hypothetical protein